jgi:hypothetical protein
MTYYSIYFLSVLLLLNTYSQNENDEPNFVEIPLIENIDTNFHLMIQNHFDVLKERGISSTEFIYIIIYPQVSRAHGVPKNIVDSLYKENKFPPSHITAGYKLILTTFDSTETKFCLFNEGADGQFLYFYENTTILIDSPLTLNFETKNKQKVKLCDSADKFDFPNKEYSTFYNYNSSVSLVEIRIGNRLLPY